MKAPEPETGVERLRALAIQECLEHLRSANLGRVAFQVDRHVDVLPVNYATAGEVVVFRTGSLTRL
jgi:uncharacterized protein